MLSLIQNIVVNVLTNAENVSSRWQNGKMSQFCLVMYDCRRKVGCRRGERLNIEFAVGRHVTLDCWSNSLDTHKLMYLIKASVYLRQDNCALF